MKTFKNLPTVQELAPNQIIIRTARETLLYSYNTVIVLIKNNITYLDVNNWDYSKTTGKYRNIFLGIDKKETQKNIDNGTFKLANLNK